jgi:hypothetical protein
MTLLSLFLTASVTAGAGQHPPGTAGQHDPHHHDLDRRGQLAMGFDQDKAAHHFRLAADGGAIEITATTPDDGATVEAIRSHLQEIEKLFASGDFTKPEFIHGEMPPGAKEMIERREDIQYRFERLPAGGRLTMRAADGNLRRALHEYLRYQIREHRTGDPTTIP